MIEPRVAAVVGCGGSGGFTKLRPMAPELGPLDAPSAASGNQLTAETAVLRRDRSLAALYRTPKLDSSELR